LNSRVQMQMKAIITLKWDWILIMRSGICLVIGRSRKHQAQAIFISKILNFSSDFSPRLDYRTPYMLFYMRKDKWCLNFNLIFILNCGFDLKFIKFTLNNLI
jgi:hypothetical protein